jgi:Xaa-Pro dipeptidase
MAVTDAKVHLTEEALARIQRHLVEMRVDGWLLYDFRGNNPVAAGLLGLPAMTRRYFVYLPAVGRPVAVTHRIEQQPWRGWIGENRPYSSWEGLERELAATLRSARIVAAEYSAGDAVPYLDRIPAGVLELIRQAGVDAVSSGDLVSAFHSRWSGQGLASHERAAAILHDSVHEAFRRIGDELSASRPPTEWGIRGWLCDSLTQRGLRDGVDAIVAVNANAANPHYAPSADEHAPIRPGDLVLIDLWGKENADSIFADQTWMAFVGETPPERIQQLWATLRDARDAAVELIRARSTARIDLAGYEVDDVARGVIAEAGLAEYFIHRTGHSIDRELHGSGPNLDNLETRDTRRLIQGIGFSVEPGIYIQGEVGLRTEIDVYMGPDGPVVTTPRPQAEIVRIPAS